LALQAALAHGSASNGRDPGNSKILRRTRPLRRWWRAVFRRSSCRARWWWPVTRMWAPVVCVPASAITTFARSMMLTHHWRRWNQRWTA